MEEVFARGEELLRLRLRTTFGRWGIRVRADLARRFFTIMASERRGRLTGLRYGTWCLCSMICRMASGLLCLKPCVDTGMGLERMLAVLEGETDNYDTSLFAPQVEVICRIIG